MVKKYVRKGQLVHFDDNWIRLCESVGFRLVCRHNALLSSGSGEQRDAFGSHKKLEKRRVSFFRRLAESHGSPRIDFETVACLEKP